MSNLNVPWRCLRLCAHPVAGCLGKESDPYLATAAFIESIGFPPEPPFLQAKQPQLPQPLPIGFTLWSFPQADPA